LAKRRDCGYGPAGGAVSSARASWPDGRSWRVGQYKLLTGNPSAPFRLPGCARYDSEVLSARTRHVGLGRWSAYRLRAGGLRGLGERLYAFPAEIGYFDENKNAVVGTELRQIIESNGFRINAEKVRLYTNTHRQSVTGLTVNEKPNIPRNFIRQIRAMIYAWDKYSLQEASQEHEARYYRRRGKKGQVPALNYIIPGKLAFIKMIRGVNDPVYRNLQAQFVKVYPGYFKVMLKENEQMTRRDVFISHASEDKESIARPLAEALILAGFLVWFDEYELRIGDSLRGKIDEGLASARYGVVVLSKNFFSPKKQWTRRELDGLTAREDADGKKRILPVWHEITRQEVASHSPTLAGLYALIAQDKSVPQMVVELAKVLRP